MKLAEFRSEYPQYDKIPDGDLAELIHKKYYGSIPFDEFSERVGLGEKPYGIPEPKETFEAPPEERPEQPLGTFGGQRPDGEEQEPYPTSLAVGGARLDAPEQTTGEMIEDVTAVPKAFGAAAAKATLGISESIFRTPDAVARHYDALVQAGRDLGLPEAVLPKTEELYVPDAINLRKHANVVANEISKSQQIMVENFDTFKALADKGKKADEAFKSAIGGDTSQLPDVLTDIEAWAGFIGNAAPTLYASLKSGGSPLFIAWMEAMESASDAADFEAETGKKIDDQEFARTQLMVAGINTWLEKLGVDKITNAKGLLGIVGSAITEGTTEGLQELVQNIAKKLAWRPKQDLAEGILPSIMGGAGTGASATSARQAAVAIGNYKVKSENKARLDQLQKAFEGLQSDLENEADIKDSIDTLNSALTDKELFSEVVAAFDEYEAGQATQKKADEEKAFAEINKGFVEPAAIEPAAPTVAGQIEQSLEAEKAERAISDKPKSAMEAAFEKAKPEKKYGLSIDEAATQVDTAPTEAQIEAGNYKKGHTTVQGLDVAIENPKGSVRTGVDEGGQKWSQKMDAHYGYIKRTQGADGDHVDVFLGPDAETADTFYVVNQKKKDGSFDEVKTMIGYNSVEEAEKAYLANYEDGWTGLRNIVEVPADEFKAWVTTGDAKKAYPNSRKARAKIRSRIPSMAADEGAMRKPEKQEVQVLRGARDKGVPAMEGELQVVPRRYGIETDKQALAGQEGQQQRVQPGKLPVGDTKAAGEKPQEQRVGRAGRKEEVGRGGRRGVRGVAEPTEAQVKERLADKGLSSTTNNVAKVRRELRSELRELQRVETEKQARRDKPLLSRAKKPEKGFVAVSPNDWDAEMSFDEAAESIRSEKHQTSHAITDDIFDEMGLEHTTHDALGDWADGAEDSLLVEVEAPESMDQMKYVASLTGKFFNQKGALSFIVDEKGVDSFYKINIPVEKGDINAIRSTLDKLKLEFRTLIPGPTGTMVVIYDEGTTLGESVSKFGKEYEQDIEAHKGTGELTGSWDSRQDGIAAYNKQIGVWERKHKLRYTPKRKGLRDFWGTGYQEQGASTEATSRTIAAPVPLSRLNSQPIPDVYGKFGTLDVKKDTTENLKFYSLDKLVANPSLVGNMVKRFGFEVKYFSFHIDEEAGVEFVIPKLKKQGYKDGYLWIYDPRVAHGSFKDTEYTRQWRIVHELGHAITEDFMQKRYGDSRREGRLGQSWMATRGHPSKKQVQVELPALNLMEAQRAVEWEDVAFRVQRMLFESLGIEVDPAGFAHEYNTNVADASYRVLTGDFGDPGEYGFVPKGTVPELRSILKMFENTEKEIAKTQGRKPTKGVNLSSTETKLKEVPRGVETMQSMRNKSKAGWAEVLPEMPSGTHAALASEAPGYDPRSATASELSKLRQRLQTEGQTTAGTVRTLRQLGKSDAPRRLQQALAGKLALPSVSPTTPWRRIALSELKKAITDAQKGDAPLLSRADKKVRGLSIEYLEKTAAAIQKSWSNAPEIIIVDNMSRLPIEIQEHIKQNGDTEIAEGVYTPHNGKVYLLANKIDSKETLLRVVMHEVMGHHGLRGILGDNVVPFLEETYRANKKAVHELAKAYDVKITTENHLEMTEEFIATQAETNPQSTVVSRVIARIAQWLRNIMPSLRLTKSELREVLVGMRQAIQTGAVPQIAANTVQQIQNDIKATNEADPTAMRAVAKFVKRNFTKEGLLNDEGFEAKIKADSLKKAGEEDVSFVVHKFEEAINKEFSSKNYVSISEENLLKVNNYLTGDKKVNLSPEFKEVLDGMRGYLDRLSAGMAKAMIDMLQLQRAKLSPENNAAFEAFLAGDPDGFVPESLRSHYEMHQTIVNNMGSYMTRSYEAFDNAKWKNKALKNKDLISRAEAFIAERNPDFSPEEVHGAVRAILQAAKDKGNFFSFLSGGTKYGTKDVSMLTYKKDVPDIIRELLGEYLDPRINFVRSTTKMYNYLANHEFLMQLRGHGLGSFLFERPTGKFDKRIAAKGAETMNPIDGLYTTEEFIQGMEDMRDAIEGGAVMRSFIRLNSGVKYGKTILAPTTQARNFMSAAMFSVMNGHFDWSHGQKAFRAAQSDLFTKDVKWRKYLNNLIQLGVLHDNPRAEELRHALEDFMNIDIYSKGPTKSLRRFLNFMQRLYQVGDDFWKIIGFENEITLQMKTGLPRKEAEVKAAYRIRNGYPTYSMVPRAVKMVRRWPLIGTFVSFPYEIVRTTANQMRFLKEDVQAGNKEMVARRTLGMAMATSISATLSYMSMVMMGLDSDDDESVRALAAPWVRNSQLVYLGYDESGYPKYIDFSYFDPYTYLKKPITAILNSNNAGIDKKVLDALTEFLAPFIGVDIAAGALMEIYSNKRAGTGTKIYNPEAPTDEIAMDMINHFRKAAQPGVVSNAERMLKAIRGETSASGKEYKLEDEAVALVGFRMGTLNVPQSIYYKTLEFKDVKSSATQQLNKVVGSGTKVTDKDIERGFKGMMKARKRGFTEMIKMVNAAEKLGVKKSVINRVLKAAKVNSSDIRYILNDRIPPWRMTSSFMDAAQTRALATANKENRSKIRKMFHERKRLVYRLMNEQARD